MPYNKHERQLCIWTAFFSFQVTSNLATYKPAELSRILWGFAAAGVEDAAMVNAVAKVCVWSSSACWHDGEGRSQSISKEGESASMVSQRPRPWPR